MTLPKPAALQMLEIVVSRLQAIQTADGFHTDIGSNVLLGVPTVAEGEFGIRVFATDEEAGPGTHPRLGLALTVNVQAQIPIADVPDFGELPELVIADIQKAVELEDRSLGGLAPNGLVYFGRKIAYPREIPSVVAAVLYLARYQRRYGSPDKRA